MKRHFKVTRLFALILAMAMLLAACGPGGDENTNPTGGDTTAPTTKPADTTAPVDPGPTKVFSVADNDEDIYFNNLEEFYDAYMFAMESNNVSQRHALLALAEAKFLEASIGITLGSSSGYSMTRQVFNSGGYAAWRGGMSDYSQYVLTNEIILKEDHEHVKTLWKELSGTGTYIAKAKEYLASKGYTFNDTIVGTFSANPTTWNLLAGATMTDLSISRPFLEYLYVYNAEGTLIPRLATGHEISADNKVYTIHIREGAVWVDSQGRKIDDVSADDWVAALQHRADVGAAWNLVPYIAGLADYANGQTTDFTTVGVKAVDKYTLEYTLINPITYFHTMFESNDFLPMCRSYFLSQGGAYGIAEYAEASAASSFTYGTDQDHIAYAGKYLCTNMTEKNSVSYVLNESYWNLEDTTVKYVKFVFDEASDVNRQYENFKTGVTFVLGLSSASMEIAKNNGDFEKYANAGEPGKSANMFWFHLHRQAYENIADGAIKSLKTDSEKALSEAAMQNTHFRLAVAYAFDRNAYYSASVGEDLKSLGIRNTITPGTFVALEESATVEINGQSVTFPAGTYYGEIVQAQLTADGFPVKVWDEKTESSEGWDAWYNTALAVEEIKLAVADLESVGFTVTKDSPIVIDYPYADYSETNQNQAYIIKTCIESALEGLVRVDLIPYYNATEMYNMLNNTNFGAEVNYDLGGNGTFGSAHGDPQCYLSPLLPFGDGDRTQRFGLW